MVPNMEVELETIGTKQYTVDDETFTLEVIDSVNDYCEQMKEIFNFSAIKDLINGTNGQKKVNILANSLHGGMCNFILALHFFKY